ncbi:MAG: hypothetical protein V1792_25160 [Pseudomonadota bacterium]
MTEYGIDRARLEEFSTEEIEKILREEKDDYTPEALGVFQEILSQRGHSDDGSGLDRSLPGSQRMGRSAGIASGEAVRNSTDAVRILNGVLAGVLDGTLEPQRAQAATSAVLGILHALEQEYMTGSREES